MNAASGPTEQESNKDSPREFLLSEYLGILESWAGLERSRRSLSAKLFRAGEDQEQIRDLLDQLDRQSDQLLSATEELLNRMKR